MSVTYGGDKITFDDGSSISSGYTHFRNRIINGDMRIDQRNAGASLTPTADAYGVDRFVLRVSQASKLSMQRNAGSITPPPGYTNYVGFTSLSSYSVTSTDYFVIGQYIEGTNIADLAWGTSDAKTVTLSFWVRSSLTGTFSGILENSDVNRSYTFTYTINAANTWEYKTITVTGDTTGTWLTTTGIGLRVFLSLGIGSSRSQTAGSWVAAESFGNSSAVSLVGTNNATFFLTGVQLEVGSYATTFERRPYGLELQLCQRYYESSGGTQTIALAASSRIPAYFCVPKRAAPTVTYTFVGGTNTVTLDQATTSGFRVNNSAGGSVSGPCDFTWTAAIEL